MKRLILSLAIAFVAIVAAQAQTCNRCGDTGVIHETCLPCNGHGSGSCFHCGGSGVKQWRCPECIAAGRI
jgi:hypothetical protein